MSWILRVTLLSGPSVGISFETMEECQSMSERIKTSGQDFIDLTEVVSIRPSQVAMISITKGEIALAETSTGKNGHA